MSTPTINVTFLVTVSAEAAPGEAISVAVTDSTGAPVVGSPFTGSTDASGNASIGPQPFPVNASFTADASVGPDSEFKGADSGPVQFTTGLADRTVALSVNQA